VPAQTLPEHRAQLPAIHDDAGGAAVVQVLRLIGPASAFASWEARLLERPPCRRQRQRLNHQAQIRNREIGSRAMQLFRRGNTRHPIRTPQVSQSVGLPAALGEM
jgi:hypothetical protein